MSAIDPKTARFSLTSTSTSTLTIALTFVLTLALTLTWVFSLRPVRLKIGDYYSNHGKFDQAVSWYGKVVRRQKIMNDQSKDHRLKYEEDLSKLKSSLIAAMEGKLLKISQILGFQERKDLNTLLANSKLFFKDIKDLAPSEQKSELKKAKQELLNYYNYKSFYENKIANKEMYYLDSVFYFLEGIIDEAEDNFISAYSNYEKVASLSPNLSIHINSGKMKVVDEYFSLSPSIKKTRNLNVLLESEFPLIITGITPGVDNLLEYETCPIKFILQKYPTLQFKIQGGVLGKIKTSCIMPRVVFWGAKGYLGETASRYAINGKFDIYFSFPVPEGTVNVTPRITFDASCFSKGQKILIEEFKWD